MSENACSSSSSKGSCGTSAGSCSTAPDGGCKITCAVRWALGLFFVVFGLNGFFHFIPPPADLPEAAVNFFGALAATGYMLPLIKGTELVGGALLLCTSTAPLGLILLAPVVVNIVLFHLFLAPSGLVFSLVIAAVNLFVAWRWRCAFAGLWSCCKKK